MISPTKETIKEYSSKYDLRYKDSEDFFAERDIKEWLKTNRYLDKQKFIRLGNWKSRRPDRHYKSNGSELVEEITKFSLSTTNEEVRIKSLMVLKGVSYPVASVILHFSFPDKYPIMDFRAIWSIGWEQPKIYTFDFWQKYCEKIRGIAKEAGESLRTVDKALWEYSKENQKQSS